VSGLSFKQVSHSKTDRLDKNLSVDICRRISVFDRELRVALLFGRFFGVRFIR